MASAVHLDPTISPTANVRRSCRQLMSDPLVDQFLEEPSDLLASASADTSFSGRRSVGIYSSSLNKLAAKIVDQILHTNDETFAEWDAEGWHYTAQHYTRSSYSCTEQDVEEQKVERILLYILALDAINFCFWPTDLGLKDNNDISARYDHLSNSKRNLLEYDTLAIALRKMAEEDDDEGRGPEECYAFSPKSLANMTPTSFLSEVKQYLPDQPSSADDGVYLIPNISERVRLLNELGHGLLAHHSGSATHMLQKCVGPNGKPSAVTLVDIITSTFRGFRDEAVDALGRQVCFYKRAQILVGDMWAAFGRGKKQSVGAELTNFDDIAELTTFADYRVPQLLRHVGVLRYSTELSARVDNEEEILAGSKDELYIRAGTVVAVDRLVEAVKSKLKEACAGPAQLNEVNAVLIDWHLWQVGEKLDRDGTLKPHHRVRTIFY